MATEYWIQLENRWWDACPNNLDRMTGQTIEERDGIAPETKTLSSPGTGKSFSREMYKPVEALILRRLANTGSSSLIRSNGRVRNRRVKDAAADAESRRSV